MILNDFLSHLDDVKRSGDQYSARCPAHDDKHNSLSVSVGKDGQIILNCHAGCQTEQVLSKINWTMKDLYPDEPTIEETWSEVETYLYIDLDGKCAEKIRKESNTGKKTFIWRQPNDQGGYTYNRKGIGHVLYNHAALPDENAVFLVEGEKDVNALAQHGKIAVCGADGAGRGKWKPEYTEQLRGKHVTIIQDNDDTGKAFALEEADALHGVAASVKVLDLTAIWPELPEHGDTSDLITHMGDAAIDAIAKLADETPEHIPRMVVHKAKVPAQNADPPQLQITAAKDLMKTVFSPLIQAVSMLICEGLTLLVSASKTGKSWLVLLMAFCVARGEPFLGRQTTKCRVLYFALEDSERRLQQRLRTMNLFDVPDNLFFVTKSQMMDAGFEQQLEGWLSLEEGPALVIVDTFQKVRGMTKGGVNAYQNDYEVIGKLKAIADKYRAMIVCVHHFNKAKFVADPFEKISGSNGLMGAADTAIILERERGQDTATIRYEGRDAWGPDFVIRFENGIWKLVSNDAGEYNAKNDYESDPLVQLFRKLITENPKGNRWTYGKLQAEGLEFLGYQPFIDGKDCANKLSDGLADELRRRDNILVECGIQTTGGRGIRLQQVSKVIAFPTKLQIDDE